ncbi:MAG: O-methyltransferase [Candidatus Methylomirabilales bacterium]
MVHNVVPREIDAYLHGWLPDRDDIQREMEAEAAARDFPIVGPVVGRILLQYVRLTKARRILEMGSGFGYAAYWMARGLGVGGRLLGVERSAEHVRRAKQYLRRGGLDKKVKLHIGEALELVRGFPDTFDLVFVDIDKTEYPASLDLTIPRLRPGGLLLTDNVLWDGRVTRPESPDLATKAVREYTRLLFDRADLYTTILPVRDGLSVSLKLS